MLPMMEPPALPDLSPSQLIEDRALAAEQEADRKYLQQLRAEFLERQSMIRRAADELAALEAATGVELTAVRALLGVPATDGG